MTSTCFLFSNRLSDIVSITRYETESDPYWQERLRFIATNIDDPDAILYSWIHCNNMFFGTTYSKDYENKLMKMRKLSISPSTKIFQKLYKNDYYNPLLYHYFLKHYDISQSNLKEIFSNASLADLSDDNLLLKFSNIPRKSYDYTLSSTSEQLQDNIDEKCLRLKLILEKLGVSSLSVYLDFYPSFPLTLSVSSCLKSYNSSLSTIMVSPEMQKLNNKSITHVNFIDGPVLSINSNSVDLITCFFSLHKILYQFPIITEFYRILKSNGIVILVDHDSLDYDFDNFLNFAVYSKSSFTQYRSKRDFDLLFRLAGFKLVYSDYYPDPNYRRIFVSAYQKL